MSRLPRETIRKQLSGYLPRAINHAFSEMEKPSERRRLIHSLVTEVIVLFHSREVGDPGEFGKRPKGVSIDCLSYPWDEHVIPTGAPDSRSFLIFKSTGEKFTEREIEWLMDGVEWDVQDYAEGKLWSADYEVWGNKIAMWAYTIDKGDYIPGVMTQIEELSERKLWAFTRMFLTVFASPWHDFYWNTLSKFKKRDLSIMVR